MTNLIKINGQTIDPLDYTKYIIEKHPNVKIHIGTDSHTLNDNTRYITAIAYRFNKSGVHYIYKKGSFSVKLVNQPFTKRVRKYCSERRTMGSKFSKGRKRFFLSLF